MKPADFKSQKGFTALGLFLAGLILITLMSATGYFVPPKSEVDDKTVYTSKGVNGVDADGLQMRNLIFDTPSAPPPTEPAPDLPTATPTTVVITDTPTPTPTGSGPTPTFTPTPTQSLLQ